MDHRDVLRARMVRPQRHRLLHGFPALPAMSWAVPRASSDGAPLAEGVLQQLATAVRRIDGALDDHGYATARGALEGERARAEARGPAGGEDGAPARGEASTTGEAHERGLAAYRARVAHGDRSEPPRFAIDPARDLIVGVIPHTQCNPRVEGCGFCTFPHDAADPRLRRRVVQAVGREIRSMKGSPLAGRRVLAVYLGGGSANLASPEQIGGLVRDLAETFDVRDAELTLEGTPRQFHGLRASHLEGLAALPVGTRRVSLGVQTFDDATLRRMGREKLGDARSVRAIAARARRLELTTSADLLFDLPGQSRAEMERDVDAAVDAGFDQICLYHLVLYEGLGTAWSKDPAMVALRRPNEGACAEWLNLRARLLARGYVQTTLTNFEREGVAHGPRRFRYEAASFSVERTDALGVGPLSLTTFVGWPERRGVKLLRAKSPGWHPWSQDDLMYEYDEDGLRLLFVTRGLAKTRLDGAVYARLFGTHLEDDFAAPLAACAAEGLLTFDGAGVTLTPTGMFYADAVVSTLAASAPRTPGAGLHTKDLLAEVPSRAAYVGMG